MSQTDIIQKITSDPLVNEAIATWAKEKPLVFIDEVDVDNICHEIFKDELDYSGDNIVRLLHYFNTTKNKLVTTAVDKNAIQAYIDNIDGEVGINEANVALNALVESTLQSPHTQLNDFMSQLSLVENVDTMIAELVLFRSTLANAIDKNETLPEESPFDRLFRDKYVDVIKASVGVIAIKMAFEQDGAKKRVI